MKGMYDVHCHILPGVDDGAESMEMALELLQREQQDGVEHIILTPHFRRGMFEPPDATVREVFARLKEEAGNRYPELELYLGCEYHVNMEMTADLRSGKRPAMAGSQYVLCEFSETSAAGFIRERCYRLVSCGYLPILAHIERYDTLRRDLGLIEELSEMGCKMQVNAGSILGDDGFSVRRFCGKLLKYGMIDLVGSDAHDLKDRPPKMGACAEYLSRKYGTDYARQILCENPAEIIASQTR